MKLYNIFDIKSRAIQLASVSNSVNNKAVSLWHEYQISSKLQVINACALVVIGMAAICKVPPFSNIGILPGVVLCALGGASLVADPQHTEPLPQITPLDDESLFEEESSKAWFLKLPDELLLEVINKLPQRDIVALGKCNKKLRAVSWDANVWQAPRVSRSLPFRNFSLGLSRYGQKMQRLDLSRQHTSEERGWKLLESLPSHCPYLKTLTMHGCSIHKRDHEAWSQMLSGLSQLSALDLSFHFVEDGTLTCIISALASRSDPKTLKYLRLNNMIMNRPNPYSNEGAVQRSAAQTCTREAFNKLTDLQEFLLRQSEGIIEVLAPSLPSASQLAVLDISEIIGLRNRVAIMESLQQLINLKKLMFSGNLRPTPTVEDLDRFGNALSNLAHLETLIFRDNGTFDQNTAECLGRALSSCTRLTTLDLSANKFMPDEFLITNYIIPNLVDLPVKTLIMQNVGFDGDEVCGLISDDENVQPFQRGLCNYIDSFSNLTYLDLRDNPAIDNEAQDVLNSQLNPGQMVGLDDGNSH